MTVVVVLISRLNHHAKFCQNPPIHCGDIAIFRFLKVAAVQRLEFVWGIFGPPTKGTWRSLSLCKLGCNRCSRFENMKVWFFARLAWKRLLAPQIGVLRKLDPLNGQQCQQNPKRHLLAWIQPYHVSWFKVLICNSFCNRLLFQDRQLLISVLHVYLQIAKSIANNPGWNNLCQFLHTIDSLILCKLIW